MPRQVLTGTVRVAVHSPDAVTRAGLVSFLEDDHRVRAVPIESIQEADIIVAAVEVVDASALDLLRGLCDKPEARFMLVVGERWQVDVSTAADRGVRAVVWRHSFDPAAFVRALLTIADGGGSLPHTLQGTLREQVGSTHRKVTAPHGLTAAAVSPREVEVLRLIAEGKELSEIATMLCYSERTVKYVLYGLTRRLQLRNRAHAVSYAIRTGLI
ncbi:helix-turn-helix transcriptional regulator [Streptantibioticus ferralitis]|uniref:Response regulator transcription factor n=1 Tax=Streptantibioticus ferralitis TaxID=236510 RepID=A0ABT5ZAZ4_9ACTN|nr:response regulator transcription factor [Streptantibioticus ferralitis]MDF2260893.1 response regulator transcription factor [Streptantibioticus ferralitis]